LNLTHIEKGDGITFSYLNWQGVQSNRKAIVLGFAFGTNDFHPEYQAMIIAYDVDKKDNRTFAVQNMTNVEHYQEKNA